MKRALLLTLILLVAGEAHAIQNTPPPVIQLPEARRVESRVRPAPFGPGERMEYEVKLGFMSVGRGWMNVEAVEEVRGRDSYHVSMGIQGGIPLARVNNHLQSWIDIEDLVARRFIQDQHEVRYRRYRHFEFYPDELRWERADSTRPNDPRSGELPSAFPLDDISFVYFVRTLPLEVGDVYTFHQRYFQESGNPVILQVLRKDRVEVPAGTFDTVVVRPIIRTRGLFSEGGEAEIHFTDDDRRIMVQMRSRVPVVGSISFHLREMQRGTQLRTFRAEDGLVGEGGTRRRMEGIPSAVIDSDGA